MKNGAATEVLKLPFWTRALAVFSLALLLRVLYSALSGVLPLNPDSLDYVTLARNLSAHSFFTLDGLTPDYTRAPGYPFLLLFIGFPALGIKVALAAGALLDSATSVLFMLSCRKFFGERPAFWTGLAYACHPVFIGFSALVLSETPFVFLWAASLLAFVGAVSSDRLAGFAAAGALLGLGVLTRPAHLYYPVALVPVFLFNVRGTRRASLAFLLFLSCFAAALSPWTVRNYLRFRAFIPVCTGGAAATWFGTLEKIPSQDELLAVWPRGDFKSLEAESAFKRAAAENWKDHPWTIIRRLPRKFFKFWGTSHSSTFDMTLQNSYYLGHGFRSLFAVKAVLLLLQGLTLAGGLAGAWVLRAQWRRVLIFLMPAAYLSAHILNDSGPSRYHISALPGLIILAMAAIDSYLTRRTGDAAGKAV
ncbi:MAG: glycosyltransferase family 39 protein [Elusimicrobia bacterium]|nr:glycosyltransferase family 39 protein [Elusimicrobiota bacterium]